ncbi:recombinase family protein [Oscillospiraceae bacterium 42-9]
MPQVQRIDPIILPSEKESVAAYCRVSTDSADQLNSYHTQIAYYTKLINDNPDWELYDLYADEGITGTSIEKRDEFKRMLADCREGKIKRVLVKSVSRFARNTTELLETTRELKDLGVVVVFEEQGFDTSQVLGEMQLTMFAMVAQEESISTANNIKWGIQKRMASGEFVGSVAPYGYELDHGELKVKPAEAETVMMIFNLYLSGKGQREIVQYLNNNNVPFSHGKKWVRSCIKIILSNERYTGDALLQKKFVESTLTHKLVVNNGERQQFFVEDHHEAIISKEIYEAARQLASNRNKKQERAQHMFTHRIICPDCGRHFREVTSSGKSYWTCPNRVNGSKTCTHACPVTSGGRTARARAANTTTGV